MSENNDSNGNHQLNPLCALEHDLLKKITAVVLNGLDNVDSVYTATPQWNIQTVKKILDTFTVEELIAVGPYCEWYKSHPNAQNDLCAVAGFVSRLWQPTPWPAGRFFSMMNSHP